MKPGTGLAMLGAWLNVGDTVTPGGAHGEMLPGAVGHGAAHWFPGSACWPQGMLAGGYVGDEYGEPPTGCVGNIERICELESTCCCCGGSDGGEK